MDRDWQEAGGTAEDEGKPEQPVLPAPEERLKPWSCEVGLKSRQRGRQCRTAWKSLDLILEHRDNRESL